jgi:signal peptidase I
VSLFPTPESPSAGLPPQAPGREPPATPAPEPPPSTPHPSRRRSKRKAKPGWAVALEWGVLIVAALLIALLIKTFLFQAFYIPSDSMVPTLKKDDRVIVNKLSYRLHPVHRGDIIVFKSPKDDNGQPIDPGVNDLVKRVIGLPGETIEGRADGHIYINGKILQESYLPKGQAPGAGFSPIKIPANAYWVMGDNRSNSRDSRFFPKSFPFVHKRDIIGRVFVRIWPLDRLGIL